MIGDLLASIQIESARGSLGRASNVASRANIAYDRMEAYLDELSAAGLITRTAGVPALTPKGAEFLKQYRAWTAVLEDFGLE